MLKQESNGGTNALAGKPKKLIKFTEKERNVNEMDLSKVSTQELVEELAKREAVEAVTAEPYQTYKIIVGDNDISDTGPVVILRVWD